MTVSPLRAALCLCFTVFLLGFALYSNISQAGFYFDASYVILDNPAIINLGNLKAIWEVFNTRFVTGLTFALNYAFTGLDPFSFRLFNITCHILSSLLVYTFVLLTFKTPVMKRSSLERHKIPIASFA